MFKIGDKVRLKKGYEFTIKDWEGVGEIDIENGIKTKVLKIESFNTKGRGVAFKGYEWSYPLCGFELANLPLKENELWN